MSTDPQSSRVSTLNRRAVVSSLALAAMLAIGCEHDAPPDTYVQVVTLSEVPDTVIAAAKKALPDVTLEDARRNLDSKTKTLHSYEIRGRNARGKVREVRVAADGRILELE